ncbi:MAG: polyphenol oxidase family protein [Sodaliphilus sp.]
MMKSDFSLRPSLQVLQWPQVAERIVAFNTLRGDAQPDDPYSAYNLCHYTGDEPSHVEQCRLALCEAIGIEPRLLVMPRQTHTTRVAVVDEALMDADEIERTARLQDVDALVTRLHGVCIGVNTADCVNIALADAEAGVIGVAHAGWRGTAGKIAARTVEAMVAQGARAERIMAVMGACICPDCFEVGDEVVEAFVAQGFDAHAISHRHSDTGKAHIHLPQANRIVLMEAGVKEENVVWNGECSRCRPEKYFSARRLGIHSGRTFTGIFLEVKKFLFGS